MATVLVLSQLKICESSSILGMILIFKIFQKKIRKKGELVNEVMDWTIKEKQLAKNEFKISSKEIIEILMELEKKIKYLNIMYNLLYYQGICAQVIGKH